LIIDFDLVQLRMFSTGRAFDCILTTWNRQVTEKRCKDKKNNSPVRKNAIPQNIDFNKYLDRFSDFYLVLQGF